MTRGTEYTESAAQLWAARAGVAERAVRARHLRRVWAVPGTRLGVSGWPMELRQRLHTRWNYWWQAHLLDCLVDAQLRQPTADRLALIGRFVRGVRLRNFRTWTNDYYDDIAWLGLALLRVSDELGLDSADGLTAITAQLRSGWTDHGGGGIWWRRGDTFKNVPANGPAAILLARYGNDRSDVQRARSMTDWMDQKLVDPETGLLWDGVYVGDDGDDELVTTIYTYCQGVFLGACVELALRDSGSVWVRRAERTIDAVAGHLAHGGVLPGNGGGDGGLFAGILARYLALAALRLPELGSNSGELAATMVFASAESAWRNRAVARSGPLFGPDWTVPAGTPRGPHDRRPERDLSVQIGGWMVMEAAASLERG